MPQEPAPFVTPNKRAAADFSGTMMCHVKHGTRSSSQAT